MRKNGRGHLAWHFLILGLVQRERFLHHNSWLSNTSRKLHKALIVKCKYLRAEKAPLKQLPLNPRGELRERKDCMPNEQASAPLFPVFLFSGCLLAVARGRITVFQQGGGGQGTSAV